MEYPQRKRLRLEAYDYSQPGYYFITICTHARQRLFDDFVGADLCVRPSPENIPLHWLWELQENSLESKSISMPSCRTISI